MKKILLFLFLIPVFAAAQKTTGGNYTYIAQRYEDFTRLFQALNLPAGDSAQHKSGQDMRSGAVYLDTVNTQTSPAGFYIYKNGVWELQDDNNICQNRFIDPITITYTGVGMKFFVSGGRYQIGCNFYSLDSATLTLDDGGTNPRKDVFYLDATGAHVLPGTEGVSPIKPQVDGDQLELTFVDVAAAATTPAPGLSTVVVYDENTEWTITNTGTTTDPDNATNVYKGSKSLNVTNISNGDIVTATGGATINVLQYDAISGFIKLKAAMSGAASPRIRFFTGATAVSNEVVIPLNKNSTDWQGFSIPISNFTFSSSSADKINIRYIYGLATVHAGFYLDFFHFESGLSQPGQGTAITVGALDGAVKSPDGGVIANDKFHFQLADATFPGLMPSVLYSKLTGLRYNYFIQNLGTLGDTLATDVNDSIVGIKRLVAGTNITLTPTDTTIVIASSGGGGGGTDNANAGAFYRWLKPTSQEIKTFANGYGILLDSTTNTDALTIKADTASTSGLASKDYVADRIAEVSGGNLITEPLGTGVKVLLPENDTLKHRTVVGANDITVDTVVATRELRVSMPVFAVGSAGLDFTLTKTPTNYTIDLPSMSPSTTRGILTNGAQTLPGVKTGTSLWVFSGGFGAGTSTSGSNFYVPGGAPMGNLSTTAAYLVEGATGTYSRAAQQGSTATTLTANYNGAAFIHGQMGMTEASSGTHPLLAGMILRSPVITNGAGATANLATVYIEGAPSGVTPTDQTNSLWVAAGNTRFGDAGAATGTISFEGATSGKVTITPAAAAGTWTWTIPTGAGTNGYSLTTNGSGVSQWSQIDLTAGVTGLLPGANGGTGVNNSGKTITLGGNLTTSGANAVTLTTTGATNVTLPTSGTLATTAQLAVLTKNINLPNPTAAENEFIFFTPVAITVTNTRAVLVGSSTPSVTYNIAFGTDRTSLTNVYTAGQTVTSTTTGTDASGVNDNTIPANSWVVLTTSAQSGTVTAINTSIQFTQD